MFRIRIEELAESIANSAPDAPRGKMLIGLLAGSDCRIIIYVCKATDLDTMCRCDRRLSHEFLCVTYKAVLQDWHSRAVGDQLEEEVQLFLIIAG